MKFCIKCDNMYYLGISKDDPNKLNYYCRQCGYVDETLNQEGTCILNTQIEKNEQKFNHIVNKYTKLDPTLPKTYNIRCPNVSCDTNTKEELKNEKNEITYIRFDDVKLKYIYICHVCNYNWLS
jgi:DNA-directed RNA polymerase subunit M/transcription elongation factor TFIIS